MGYTTDFAGQFEVRPEALSEEMTDYLTSFAETRRMKRDVNGFGVQGEFYVYGEGPFGQDRDKTVIDGNSSPHTQPGLWCQWVPTDDGEFIVWDGGEKFYDYVEWLKYIAENFLLPFDKYLSGEMIWQGEEIMDRGRIVADKDIIKTVEENGVERTVYLNARNYFKSNYDVILRKKGNDFLKNKRKEISEYMEDINIPEHMRNGVLDYVMNGTETGHFLSALFSNDLAETFSRADGTNKAKISEYVTLMYNCLPVGCWGSKEKHREWKKQKGLVG